MPQQGVRISMSKKQLEVNDISRIVVKDVAMGMDYTPNASEIVYYIRREQYVAREVGSKGYDLLVWTDDGYKMSVIAVADTPKDPEKAIIRGGKL